MDSNCGPLVLEATALPTEQHPLSFFFFGNDLNRAIGLPCKVPRRYRHATSSELTN